MNVGVSLLLTRCLWDSIHFLVNSKQCIPKARCQKLLSGYLLMKKWLELMLQPQCLHFQEKIYPNPLEKLHREQWYGRGASLDVGEQWSKSGRWNSVRE